METSLMNTRSALAQTSRLSAGTPTIFVVDDDHSLCRGLARLIQSAGWAAETFFSAQDFLQRPAYPGTGCVLLDVQMPGMNGPELHDWMAGHGISLPVIYLTAHGDVPTGVGAMVDFLQKPVDDETLLQAIQLAIERHAGEQQHRRQTHEIELCLTRLSLREREVMGYVIAGYLNKQIADKMGISIKTVKAHRGRVMEKMEVSSVAELVHLCDEVGMSFPQAGKK